MSDPISFTLDDLFTYKWPRRVVLSLAILAVVAFADFGATASWVFLSALIVVTLTCEALDIVLLRRDAR
jgi:hypothetical protein